MINIYIEESELDSYREEIVNSLAPTGWAGVDEIDRRVNLKIVAIQAKMAHDIQTGRVIFPDGTVFKVHDGWVV